ncbi:MAG: DinB family protein [Chloroflexi bacterium]|nr:DinB family protein [Chloroflexota bacterium]
MSDGTRAAQIAAIAALPDQLRELVAGLDDATLTTVLVPGEWTVAQNVHHLADSHAQAFNRARLILTEAHPTITPYDQDAWARLPEAMAADLEPSLLILAGLHQRWAAFWRALPEPAWERSGWHPERGELRLDDLLQYYAAHGVAHLDQIRRTLAARAA